MDRDVGAFGDVVHPGLGVAGVDDPHGPMKVMFPLLAKKFRTQSAENFQRIKTYLQFNSRADR